MGAHGEAGVERHKLAPADDLADEMMRLLLADLPFKKGDGSRSCSTISAPRR